MLVPSLTNCDPQMFPSHAAERFLTITILHQIAWKRNTLIQLRGINSAARVDILEGVRPVFTKLELDPPGLPLLLWSLNCSDLSTDLERLSKVLVSDRLMSEPESGDKTLECLRVLRDMLAQQRDKENRKNVSQRIMDDASCFEVRRRLVFD